MASLYDMIGINPDDLGWIPPEKRTAETTRIHNEIMERTPIIATDGYYGARPKWSVAWQYEPNIANFDQFRRKGHLKNLHQLTGSCVGFGAANMAFWSSVTDAIYFADPTRVVFPFFGYHYGLGRLESGIRGRGEGSSGSGQAEALRKYGILAYDQDGVPAPNNGDDIQWTSSIEYQWSDGNGPAQQYIETGKKHLFTNYTKATTIDQAKDLMASKYWGTTASNWGGLMACPTAGDGNNKVLLNHHATSWSHQQWVCGYWEHPSLGDLFTIGNNWGYVHGEDPLRIADENTPPPAPPGTYWVNAKDFQSMMNGGETFFFSGLNGFPARPGLYNFLS